MSLQNPKEENKVTTAPNQEVEENYIKISLVNQSVSFRKKKSCPLKLIPIEDINYKNLRLLNKFLSERGKIISSRITGVELPKQRALAKAVKIARRLALLSPISKDNSIN